MPVDGKTSRGRTYRRLTLSERFWPKVNTAGPVVRADLGPCWIWTASIIPSTGYGCLNHARKTLSAHAVSWVLAGNPAPGTGLELCHRCDVRSCVNPEHLFVGTRSDNMRDAVSKGRTVQQHSPERMRRGSRHHQAKLTESQVRQIRDLHATGKTTVALAERFGVSATMVGYIVRRRFWRHVP